MSERLQGRAALITGSTGNIGKAIAIRFTAEGARVVVTGRDNGRPPCSSPATMPTTSTAPFWMSTAGGRRCCSRSDDEAHGQGGGDETAHPRGRRRGDPRGRGRRHDPGRHPDAHGHQQRASCSTPSHPGATSCCWRWRNSSPTASCSTNNRTCPSSPRGSRGSDGRRPSSVAIASKGPRA